LRKLNFSSVILSIVLTVLTVVSLLLLAPAYQGSQAALHEEIRLAYKKDKEVLNRLFAEYLKGIARVAEEIAQRGDIRVSALTGDQMTIEMALYNSIQSRSGDQIDAFVVELDNRFIEVPSVSLIGLNLPLQELSSRYTLPGTWSSLRTRIDGKEHHLLRLSLPIISDALGEVIGQLHSFILLNDNFWILNEIQSVTGAKSVAMFWNADLIGGLAQRPAYLDALKNYQSNDESFSKSSFGVTHEHTLTFGEGNSYHVRLLIEGKALEILQKAYNQNLSFGVLLVLGLGIATMLLIRHLTRSSLIKLLDYAESVPNDNKPVPFTPTAFTEFNRVGNALEQMVNKIRDRENYLNSILINSPSLIFIKDLELRYRLVNPNFAAIVGRTSYDILGKTDFEIFDSTKARVFSETDLRVIEQGQPEQHEYSMETSEGLRYFLSTKFPILGEDKRPYCIAGIVTDITERKENEEHLNLASQVFDEAAEAILVVDQDQNVIIANTAFCQLTGYDKAEASDVGFTFPEDRPEILQDLTANGRWQGEAIQRRKNGEAFPVWLSISLSQDDVSNTSRYVVVFSDISRMKEAEQRLEKLAHYDSLTGLPNRSLFFDRLHLALARSEQRNNRTALLFLDIDRFKTINDSFGHDVGDELLQEVANRLQGCIRPGDTISRLGGDEFTIILSDVDQPDIVQQISRKILEDLRTPIYLADRETYVSGSIGVAVYPDDGTSPNTLLKNADTAMYHVKEQGRNGVQFYDAAMNEHAAERIRLEEGLRRALSNEELVLHFQPRFHIDGSQIIGAEALVRWIHPQDGMISPARFIPLAEETGLIVELGRTVLKQACIAAVEWNQYSQTPVPVSVNLSPRQLKDSNLLSDIEHALNSSGLPPQLLELEITETVVIEDIETMIGKLQIIRDMGVRLSVDDFGTGYSSLIYLKRLPVDTVKIDRSFVDDVPGDADDETIIEAIISMAHSLKLQVVAEGVETEEQLAFLKGHGCDEVQGFLLGRPDIAQKMVERLQQAEI